MRRWRTTEHENGFQQEEAGSVSVVQALVVSDCLKVVLKLATTQIPLNRLTRVGKGTTFCRTRKREGRMTVSVTDLRRSNRLRWRRYANSGGTRLWIRRTSGHSSGLLIDRWERRQSAEADTNLRHHDTRAAQPARMVALPRLHPCGYGEHGSLLETRLRHLGGRVGDRGGQRATRQEGSWAQDRRKRCGMGCRLTLPRAAPLQVCSAESGPRTTRFNPLSSQAGGGAQSPVETFGERQYQVGQRGHRCIRNFRSADAASSDRREGHCTRNGGAGPKEAAQQDSPTAVGLGRKARRSSSFSVEVATGSPGEGRWRSSGSRATHPGE